MNKIIKLLTQEVATVVMLGIVSVITAWAGVQSSLHDEVSDKALSIYMEGLSDANNMFLTSELKYRTDLAVWAEKQTILNNGGNIFGGFSAGSAELYELAIPFLIENPKSQLPDCKIYMDTLYLPQQHRYEEAIESLHKSEISSEYSDRLQMLTAILAVALFMLGITSVIRQEKLKFAIILGAIAIAIMSITVLLRVPVVSVSW
jgi:hypothetical protein